MHPTVITGDRIDRPPIKIAMTTACDILELPWISLSEFVVIVGLGGSLIQASKNAD